MPKSAIRCVCVFVYFTGNPPLLLLSLNNEVLAESNANTAWRLHLLVLHSAIYSGLVHIPVWRRLWYSSNMANFAYLYY